MDCHVVSGSVTADRFSHFVEQALVPCLQQFNGVNPNSVVVMDNASIHHAENAVQLIQNAGAIVQFLPPYSPDFNPIEEAFSKVKSVLKATEDLWSNLEHETAVLAAFNAITPADCQGWISHCGYVQVSCI